MADFAQWITAAEPYFPFPPGYFAAAYDRNRQEIIDETVESDPVISAVKKFAMQHGHWSGTPSDLLNELKKFSTDEERRLSSWPRAANSLKYKLNRSATFLRQVGVKISSKKSGINTTTITYTPSLK
jgi:hypothetical protein